MFDSITGFKTSGNSLHLGHVPLVKEIIKGQQRGEKFGIVLADLQSITPDPKSVEISKINGLEILKDLYVLGVDIEKTTIWMQSLVHEILAGSVFLSLFVQRNEIDTEQFNQERKRNIGKGTLSIFQDSYVIGQVSDIIFSGARKVYTAPDQDPITQIACSLISKFNEFGLDLPVPISQSENVYYVTSTDGEGKMSKGKPDTLINLKEDIDSILIKLERTPEMSKYGNNILIDYLRICSDEVSYNLTKNDYLSKKISHKDLKNIVANKLSIFTSDFKNNFDNCDFKFAEKIYSDSNLMNSVSHKILSDIKRKLKFI